MNPLDHQLHRLLRAAARAERPATEALPFAVEQRVLAAWRVGAVEDNEEALLVLFRRVLIGACVITLLALAASYKELTTNGNEVEMVTTALEATIAP
jgi:hypothetical protein